MMELETTKYCFQYLFYSFLGALSDDMAKFSYWSTWAKNSDFSEFYEQLPSDKDPSNVFVELEPHRHLLEKPMVSTDIFASSVISTPLST